MHQLFEKHKAPAIALLGLEVWLENKIHKQWRKDFPTWGGGQRINREQIIFRAPCHQYSSPGHWEEPSVSEETLVLTLQLPVV